MHERLQSWARNSDKLCAVRSLETNAVAGSPLEGGLSRNSRGRFWITVIGIIQGSARSAAIDVSRVLGRHAAVYSDVARYKSSLPSRSVRASHHIEPNNSILLTAKQPSFHFITDYQNPILFKSEDMMTLTVGVLALQGGFHEHLTLLERAATHLQSAEPAIPAEKLKFTQVRTSEQLAQCDALVIPGGESTTISLVAGQTDLLEKLRDFVK